MIPNHLQPIVKAAYEGTLQQGEVLTFRRILEIAEREANKQGSVGYSAFEPELLTECLNGSWPISQMGFRLQTIRQVLKQEGWKYDGRPVRYHPPR